MPTADLRQSERERDIAERQRDRETRQDRQTDRQRERDIYRDAQR